MGLMEQSYTVVIADDIFTNRLLLSEIIEDLGHKYIAVENGKQAIEALEKNNVDLVLMDIEMPVMNGLEATIYIREKLSPPKSTIPVIALTANVMRGDREKSLEAGCDGYIEKPIDIDLLPEQIQRFLRS